MKLPGRENYPVNLGKPACSHGASRVEVAQLTRAKGKPSSRLGRGTLDYTAVTDNRQSEQFSNTKVYSLQVFYVHRMLGVSASHTQRQSDCGSPSGCAAGVMTGRACSSPYRLRSQGTQHPPPPHILLAILADKLCLSSKG